MWEAPLLRGLDARARAEIEAAGSMRTFRAGDVMYRPGDPADALFVVASGACAIHAVRRGEAGARIVRRAGTGELLGEDATVASFSTRALEARCEADATVAEVPLVVLRRAVGRSGTDEAIAKIERGLRRAATLDLLRTTSFTSSLAEGDLALLLDAARHVHVARGEHVYRAGDVASDAFFVADGLLQAQTDDEGKPRVEAYLARGDLFGDEELADRSARNVAVVANGPSWLIAIARDAFLSVARKNGDRLRDARRLATSPAPIANGATTVFQDLYRLRVAKSLLVIDQDSCIRCGHCAWSCADVHEDGISRLIRQGDKIVVREAEVTAPLLVPNSCQHCKNPSCMIDCPTGAIGRDARGEVFIREDLCTGCGSCAKACPWDNIQLAPRTDKLAYPAVAVKCDLCKGKDGGPACVAACPVSAIARVDPNTAFATLRVKGAPVTPGLPAKLPAWPWALGAALAGFGVPGGAWVTGIGLGALVTILVVYSAAKRTPRIAAGVRGRVPLARSMYIAHLAVGALAVGVLVRHVGLGTAARVGVSGVTAGAATFVAMAIALVSGAFGAVVSAFVPRMLARIERKSVLPEDLAAQPKELDRLVYASLSGKGELVKTIFASTLRPYRRARLGAFALLLSRRRLRDEEKRLRATCPVPKNQRAEGLDDLVRLVVEERAVRAQRWLTWLLRGWLVPHLAATAAVIVLLVLHVIAVTR